MPQRLADIRCDPGALLAPAARSDFDAAGRFPTARLAALCTAIASFAAVDILLDFRVGATRLQLFLEAILFSAALGAAAYFCARYVQTGRRGRLLLEDLETARADAERWRQEAANVLPALGAAIERQLLRWGLDDEERRMALLLLNGLTAREIAGICGADEGAVRARSDTIYRKAGLSGRAELSAFFLQDLLFLTGHETHRRSGAWNPPRAAEGEPAAPRPAGGGAGLR